VRKPCGCVTIVHAQRIAADEREWITTDTVEQYFDALEAKDFDAPADVVSGVGNSTNVRIEGELREARA
jgi:hypothetical protein